MATTSGGPSSYDIFDGYVPVNREGGGFPQAPCEYYITGDVRGLEYWDGHLDGTLTVTQIPEPGGLSLILLLLLATQMRTRRQHLLRGEQ